MIDKDELIEIIKYSSKWNKPCPEWVCRLIEATPEKTGKWKEIPPFGLNEKTTWSNSSGLIFFELKTVYECSECKKIADNDYDYCPHCGAKMC